MFAVQPTIPTLHHVELRRMFAMTQSADTSSQGLDSPTLDSIAVTLPVSTLEYSPTLLDAQCIKAFHVYANAVVLASSLYCRAQEVYSSGVLAVSTTRPSVVSPAAANLDSKSTAPALGDSSAFDGLTHVDEERNAVVDAERGNFTHVLRSVLNHPQPVDLEDIDNPVTRYREECLEALSSGYYLDRESIDVYVLALQRRCKETDYVFCPTSDFCYDVGFDPHHIYSELVARFIKFMRASDVYRMYSDSVGTNPWVKIRQDEDHTLKVLFLRHGFDGAMFQQKRFYGDSAASELPTSYQSAHAVRWQMCGRKRYVVCPLRHADHFTMFIVDTQTDTLYYMNSLGGHASDQYAIIALRALSPAFNRDFIVNYVPMPRQSAMECGVCICLFMYMVANDGVKVLERIRTCHYKLFLEAELCPVVLKVVADRELQIKERDSALAARSGASTLPPDNGVDAQSSSAS